MLCVRTFEPCDIGGFKDIISTEVLTDSGWENTPSVLPVGMYVTCMVAIDDDTYFVHGGQNVNTEISPKTFVFTASTGTWTQGPDLTIGRFGEGCGSLPMNEKSSKISIIVAGGFSRYIK